MHAEMWLERLRDEPRFREALDELCRTRLACRGERPRSRVLTARGSRRAPSSGAHTTSWPQLWEEMTMVRRSEPGAAW